MTDNFINEMTKKLVEVQPIHKDKKVREAFAYLFNNKEWSMPCSCKIDNLLAEKGETK